MKDIFGKALLDYQENRYVEDIITWTSISEEDVLPLPYLFRTYPQMPKLEQKALQLCKGSILDVGCGSGCHTLWLQEHGFIVKAIDISKGAVDVALQRGVLNIEHLNILDETDTFDTLLLVMNGTGVFETLSHAPKYLEHLKLLLKPNGQILVDSSDIRYMYDSETIIDYNVDALNRLNNDNYYGELDYFISYKGLQEQPIKWLYLDFKTLRNVCHSIGLHCEKIMDGKHYDYLARITVDNG